MWKIIEFDYNKHELYWYENPKSKEVISSLTEAIKQWIKLPLFEVFEFEPNKFSLNPRKSINIDWKSFVDGWHHRAIAYLRLWKVFPVKLVDIPNIPVHMLQRGYINIKNIKIIEDKKEYIKRKKRYKNYL